MSTGFNVLTLLYWIPQHNVHLYVFVMILTMIADAFSYCFPVFREIGNGDTEGQFYRDL